FWCPLSFPSAVSRWKTGCVVVLHRFSTKRRTIITQTAALESAWRKSQRPQRRQRWEQINADSRTAHYLIQETCFQLNRVVLDIYVELGSCSRRSGCLVLPRMSWRTNRWFVGLKKLLLPFIHRLCRTHESSEILADGGHDVGRRRIHYGTGPVI